MNPRDLAEIRDALASEFRVTAELGRGGMATVYLAEDRAGDRVAIKVLRPELSAAYGPERFAREVRVTASLEHPAVVPVLATGQVLGLPYYVMPYLEGQSLQERVRAEGALSVSEAVDIALQVGDVLAAAHRLGIVHRDIKPSNIFLSNGTVLVTDFGIARLVDTSSEERLTESGVVIGTAGYMSPEQANASRAIDARSDLYSLGCVLFEMLTGEPPFSGRTREAVLAKQLALPSPSVTTLRPTVSSALDAVVTRALAKTPADRFQTADDFVHDLLRARDAPSPTRSLRVSTVAVAAVVVLVLGASALVATKLRSRAGTAGVDTTLYALFPVQLDGGTPADSSIDDLLGDAFGRWSGISLVDPFRMRGALEKLGPGVLTASTARRTALSLGAGRFVQAEVSTVGGTTRVHAVLSATTGSGAVLADRMVRLREPPAPALDTLVDELLLGTAAGTVPEAGGATRSLPARRAFLRGRDAMARWQLLEADSAFSEAVAEDPKYSEAYLWLALSRAWRDQAAATWAVPAQQALLGLDSTRARSLAMANAVAAEADGDLARACPDWRRLAATDSLDADAWYGFAVCEASDNAVVRDRGSPSGFSFRSSYNAALDAYERAFRLQPAILASYGDAATDRIGSLFRFTGVHRRRGRGVTEDAPLFAADPAWVGDTLAFVPFPVGVASARATTTMAAQRMAFHQLRLRFRDVAAAWSAQDPGSADALEALAHALAMLGDGSALDTLRRARTLARTPAQRRGVMASEVWMLVALSVPDDTAGVLRARALADSVLAGGESEQGDASSLASLAALTGRGNEVADLYLRPEMAESMVVPAPLRTTAPPLLALSALGGPAPRIRTLEGAVMARIDEALPASQRSLALLQWIVRPATLAFPVVRFRSFDSLGIQNDYLWNLQLAWIHGDTAAVREGFDRIRTARAGTLPENLTLDALYPEASLLLRMGKPGEAARWIDPTLHALPQVAPANLAEAVQAASLVRAMALRARIAAALHDMPSARAWSRAVLTLWSGADAVLASTLAPIRTLAH